MSSELSESAKAAAEAWARDYFQTSDAIGYAYEDEEDEDEPGRFVVSLAIPTLAEWQAVEVWVEDGQVVAVNWLGEGLAPEDVDWPFGD